MTGAEHQRTISQLLKNDDTAREIAARIGRPIGEVETTIATIEPS